MFEYGSRSAAVNLPYVRLAACCSELPSGEPFLRVYQGSSLADKAEVLKSE